MISILKDKHEISVAAADIFVKAAKAAIQEKDSFTVALTGGSSPAELYALLAASPYKEQVDWEKVYIFWGDERWVPLDDERSNARMAAETLLDHVPIPKTQIHPMWADVEDPEKFAQYYEQLLRRILGPSASFDLILLGMGDDGHTASLFPGKPVLYEKDKWVTTYYLTEQSMVRITLTAPLINQAKKIVFVLFGAGKAPALYEVLEGERNFEKYPSQLIQPAVGEAIWLVDEAAAAKLSNK
ncbi:6-phosphogluconolactonase [Mucilaginibacter gynuensis]|uniref:6-phosphogluconolactonase n=1 Tax=Mucilaginibacter gynuensis TaxID=1302236 RepID=A0ABP8GDI2_9SPHI